MSVAEEVLGENVQETTGLKPGEPIDWSEEYKQIFQSGFDAFPPESPLEIEDLFAAGDRVVCRFRSRQKSAKDFFGVPASNRVVTLVETHVQRLSRRENH